jgi:hypothetical protein
MREPPHAEYIRRRQNNERLVREAKAANEAKAAEQATQEQAAQASAKPADFKLVYINDEPFCLRFADVRWSAAAFEAGLKHCCLRWLWDARWLLVEHALGAGRPVGRWLTIAEAAKWLDTHGKQLPPELLGSLPSTTLQAPVAGSAPVATASTCASAADSGLPTEPRGESTASPIGFLGGEALANALGVHAKRRDAFLRQLDRKRMSLGDDCWHEVQNARPNSPRFIYRADSPKLRDLAAAYKNPKPA